MNDDFAYPLLQGLLYDTPLLIAPSKADLLHQVLQGHAAGNPPPVDAAVEYRADANRARSYRVTTGGIAVIPVLGTLVHRGGFLDALSGITSYSRLARRVREAAADAEVKGILLDVDSPGGSVPGLFDLGAELRQVAQHKPIWSISNESMFSAAYAIGAATQRIAAPTTGMAGSIGVILMHMDQSEKDRKAGLSYTAIYAGDRKNDGSSHEPLSDPALQTYQHMVDHIYGVFVEHVATGRGLDAEAVRNTEAQIYTADQAQDVGLIDTIASFDDFVAEFEGHVARGPASIHLASASTTTETIMTDETTMADAITQADLDAARAEGKQEGIAEGIAAEQERINAILNLESAGGLIDGTLKAAIETGQTAEAADKFLAAVPRQAQGAGFLAAMAAVENPDVSADAGGESDFDADALAKRAVSLI